MTANTLTRLQQLVAESPPTDKQFGQYQEEAIVSLALDFPEFFLGIGHFIKPNMFTRVEAQFVIANILDCHQRFGGIPTRHLLRDHIERQLTEDDPFEEVLRLVDRKSDPREIPMLKDSLINWARIKAYGLLYSDEAQGAYHRGDFRALEEIVNSANRIADVADRGFWFFEQFEELFLPSTIEHRTTGFPQLDALLNNGGPSAGEVCCWLAATNVGKSILLCNNAIASVQGLGPGGTIGQNVLFVTFELDVLKTAMRCVGACVGINLNEIILHEEYVRRQLNHVKTTYKKGLYICELPPDECSVNHIYAIIDNLKRSKGWKPDVVVIDYLELMVSRNQAYNKDDYTSQKHVATEVRGLARNEQVLVFTATQTNRSGSDSQSEHSIDLNQAAESYGKNMPLDYVISLNQTDAERGMSPPQIRFFVAKNRNGPKHQTVHCTINYDTMQVREAL